MHHLLEAITVLDEDPRIVSCFQFVLALNYCCEIFGDTASAVIEDAIKTAMEKRCNNSHGLFGVSGYLNTDVWSSHPSVKGILEQYMSTQDNKVSEKRHCTIWYDYLELPLQLPLQISSQQFLNLHYRSSSCPENQDSRWCKVAVDIFMTVKDFETSPDITIQLVEDSALLERNKRNAHFHQDPAFLQYISVSGNNNGVTDFTFCKNRNIQRENPSILDPIIDAFYIKLQCDGKIELFIRWPVLLK